MTYNVTTRIQQRVLLDPKFLISVTLFYYESMTKYSIPKCDPSKLLSRCTFHRSSHCRFLSSTELRCFEFHKYPSYRTIVDIN